LRPARPREEQILVWCGVVTQLVRTRANRLLDDRELAYPLFVLLRHFCHDPGREWTVTGLVSAFETNQPAVTKRVKQLLDKGLLAARPDPNDARVRWLRVTRKGIRLRDRLVRRLEPDQRSFFAGWERSEITELHRLLERLKTHLDDHRDDPWLPGAGARRPGVRKE